MPPGATGCTWCVPSGVVRDAGKCRRFTSQHRVPRQYIHSVHQHWCLAANPSNHHFFGTSTVPRNHETHFWKIYHAHKSRNTLFENLSARRPTNFRNVRLHTPCTPTQQPPNRHQSNSSIACISSQISSTSCNSEIHRHNRNPMKCRWNPTNVDGTQRAYVGSNEPYKKFLVAATVLVPCFCHLQCFTCY